MSKRSRDTDDIPSRNVKAKHDGMSTASTKEGDLRDATEFKRQDSMDSTQSQYPDKETVPLSRSASDSLTVYKRGLEKMDLDQSVKNIDALEVKVAKKIMAEAKLAEDYAAQVKRNRKIVKTKKALKHQLKVVEDENEEVKDSLYTLQMRFDELKEQLDQREKDLKGQQELCAGLSSDVDVWERAFQQTYKELKSHPAEAKVQELTAKINILQGKLQKAKKMEKKQQHLIKRLEKDLQEEQHLVDFQAFISKGEMERLRVENKELKAEKEDSAMEIASQQMDIENFHAVATEARATVEKLKKELISTTINSEGWKQELAAAKVEIEEWKMESKGLHEICTELKAESEFASIAKDALRKQLHQTEAKLLQAQQESDKFKAFAHHRGVASFPSTAETVVPGAFIRVKGANAEGKKELWYALINKVNPADLSITVGRYYERAYDSNGCFLMAPCDASAGEPLKGEWLNINAFQVINHFPVCDVSDDNSMKVACERAGWGPFDNCDQHTAEQHATMMEH